MTALDNKLFWIKNCAELLLKDTQLAISSLEEERKHKENNKAWVVFWLDEVWVLDRDTIRLFHNREDAYKYYKELAQDVLEWYKKNNERLKRPTVISDFTEKTYFLDSDYPEFWIDNKKNGNCQIFFEYEECILREYFIS